MPNHITNILKVSGSKKEVADLFKKIKGVKKEGDELNHLIDFNKIVPMPPTLNITSGSGVDNAVAILTNDDNYFSEMLNYPWVKNEKIKTIEQLKHRIKKNLSEKDFEEAKMSIENIEKYGHKNWYDWSIANWGTKWNSYDNARIDENTISFDTAWSTPFPVILKLSQIYSNLTISVEFADEDIGSNCGRYVLKGGVLIEEYLPNGYEATKYALSVKGSEYGVMDFLTWNLTNLPNEELVEAKKDISNILSDEDLVEEFLSESFNNHNEQDLERLKGILKDICIEYELYELIKDIESR